MRLALIVAMANGRVIGRDGEMPWHLPAELRYFRRVTTGHALVMGRKTFAAIGRPLPNRHSIVLTRSREWSHPGVDRAASLDEALVLARAAGERGFDADTAFVIGGAEIYALAMPRASALYLTRIDLDVVGDTYFPAFDADAWTLASVEVVDAADNAGAGMRFEVYGRRKS